jgi:hypothetical protein
VGGAVCLYQSISEYQILVEFFDKEENSVCFPLFLMLLYQHLNLFILTGTLTRSLSENPQNVNSLAGVTLGVYVDMSTSQVVLGTCTVLFALWITGLYTSPINLELL